jgi:hypothetical protein
LLLFGCKEGSQKSAVAEKDIPENRICYVYPGYSPCSVLHYELSFPELVGYLKIDERQVNANIMKRMLDKLGNKSLASKGLEIPCEKMDEPGFAPPFLNKNCSTTSYSINGINSNVDEETDSSIVFAIEYFEEQPNNLRTDNRYSMTIRKSDGSIDIRKAALP